MDGNKNVIHLYLEVFSDQEACIFIIFLTTVFYSTNPNIFAIMSYNFFTSNGFHYLLYCQVKPVDYRVTDLGGQLLNTGGAKGLMATDLT